MTDPGEPRAPETPGGMLSVGDVVSDRYRIDAVLGEGGMGIVYRAEHLHLHKPHALKVLLPAWSSMSEVVARFEREAVAAGRIESPHVAAATDFGTLPDGSFFLVMEYVDGRTLRSALDEGPLEPVRAVHILRGIVSGLGVAHAIGVVHRDLKPENVMLVARDGDPDFVKVLDFGVARIDAVGGVAPAGPSQPLTMVGAVIGTPDYMSPEQALGQRGDARSDLYSVGVILFEMLTGRCPFEGGAVTVLRQHVTAELPELSPVVTASLDPRIGVILRRLLAKLPEDRFASTADLTAALDACTDECGPAPRAAAIRRTEAVEPLLRYATRGRVTAAIIVVAVLATMIIVLAVSGGSTPTSTVAPTGTDSAGVVAPTDTSPPSPSTGPVDVAPVTTLPPPPSPWAAGSGTPPSRASPSASSQGQRRTGPGGIYIPPPSQWFR